MDSIDPTIPGGSWPAFLLRLIGLAITLLIVILPWEAIARRAELKPTVKRGVDGIILFVLTGLWMGWD